MPLLACLTAGLLPNAFDCGAGALEDYVAQKDASYSWKRTEQVKQGDATVTHLELISQTWRGQFWSHHLQIVRPPTVRAPHIALIFVTGDGEGQGDLPMLKTVAESAGALAAVLTKVPNQPLYDGRNEDSLISYTFDQFLRTEDPTWPLLFPMVKSAVRAMDTVQSWAQDELKQKVECFVICGASKRGWTTWLTGAVDRRVKAIAPMVIDMLNMKKQTQWAQQMYGSQSEEIDDYSKAGLIDKMDDPRMVRLRGWVDPYSYRNKYTLPKLLLLGTNDPYWTVDALRHYWHDLPDPKWVFQTPNAGHDLGDGKQAIDALAAFYQAVADDKPLPQATWVFKDEGKGKATLGVTLQSKPEALRLWTAESSIRDFRKAKWMNKNLDIPANGAPLQVSVSTPKSGFLAYMVEMEYRTPAGGVFRLSTEARVTPDGPPARETK
jgi:PhoPQ-activated pathogenicity-related protein